MLGRVTGALTRALLVGLLVATPALLLPPMAATTTEIVLLIAILASTLTFIEYVSTYPSLIEFRDAPPINRLRFASLFSMIFFLTVIFNHALAPTPLSAAIEGLGGMVGRALDFPYSPVHLAMLMVPADTPAEMLTAVRAVAGLALIIALMTVGLFIVTVRLAGWPTNAGVFNVWINLPLFDPTTGGDVILRLQRDGRINLIGGALMPFLIPALVTVGSAITGPLVVATPHVLIWAFSAWGFLPASMAIRGIAMLRVAELIEDKRRRAYASAKDMQAA